jgi:TonB family protein
LDLGVTHRKETVVDEARFAGGLKLSSSTGLAVGPGALSTLGDADVDSKSVFEGKDREGIAIVTKPRPAYTEAARQSNTQGTVILRVTFLRNGGVGSVSVVKALPFGLTEQAIAAGRRMSFLPGTVDGKPISITKLVEYSFSLY